MFYSGIGHGDPVTIEFGVTQTPLHFAADPLVSTFTFKGFTLGAGSLLLGGVALTVGQVLTGDQFESLSFGPASLTGDFAVEFDISDGLVTEQHREWVVVAPALNATYTGSGGDDLLDGGAGNDEIVGLAGNDTMLGGAGNDRIDGGTGRDIADGAAGIDNMSGGSGMDVLRGGAGADVLTGGFNADVLFGGIGNDVFVFGTSMATTNRDIIADFFNVVGNNDTIHLDNAVMPALGAAGRMLDPDFFWRGATAHDADDHILYNRATGALYYDANGNQFGGVFLLALLTNKPNLTASDFVVI